jgi:rhodanese-related sulfurtransferase
VPTIASRSPVTDVRAATPAVALAHFERLFEFETDCWDVHASMGPPGPAFVLLDVRGPDRFKEGHVTGAVNLPHARITARSLDEYQAETLFVVYCDGPHCNGADRAAVRLARLNRPVKKMIGGIEGWKAEGFPLETT